MHGGGLIEQVHQRPIIDCDNLLGSPVMSYFVHSLSNEILQGAKVQNLIVNCQLLIVNLAAMWLAISD